MRCRAVLALLAATAVSLPVESANAQSLAFEPIVTGAEFPTNLAPDPDGSLLYTEKETGRVRVVEPDGTLRPQALAEFDVTPDAERGLLGIARMAGDPWIYLYLSDATDQRNRVVRIPLDGGSPETVVDLLPSVSGYHNGGDIAFAPDGMLYVVTGEAHDPDLAQDPSSLGGKLLRMTPDGEVPDDNPTDGSFVFANGIRNSFGICIDPSTGDVWETENGPDRDDEVNRVTPGANLGWPLQLGPGGAPRFVDPVLTFEQVIVPTGCAVTPDGVVYFGDIGGNLHRVTVATGGAQDEIVAHLPAGIIDVATDRRGRLLVATVDAIYRQRVEATASPSSADSEGDQKSPTVSTAGSDPGTSGWWIGIGIAVIAIVAIAAALVRRRSEGRGRRGPPSTSSGTAPRN